MTLHVPPPKPESPFSLAIAALRAAGHRVEPASVLIPGLCHIDNGPELTMGQVIDVAVQKGLLKLS